MSTVIIPQKGGCEEFVDGGWHDKSQIEERCGEIPRLVVSK
jgi:hypothetical protein